MDEFGFYQEVYPVVLYIGDNPTVVTFHNDTVVEAIVIYNRPETAYPVRLWVEGKGRRRRRERDARFLLSRALVRQLLLRAGARGARPRAART